MPSKDFQTLLTSIIARQQHSHITFYEFMISIKESNIHFYSKDEVRKVSKLFDCPFKTLPKHLPFTYLELLSIQISFNTKYYIVGLRRHPLRIPTQPSSHHMLTCLECFKDAMTKAHGKQSNWFRGLGALSNRLNSQAFKASLKRIMKNTNHSLCSESLANCFLASAHHPREIEWDQFMKVLHNHADKQHRRNKTQCIQSNTPNDFNPINTLTIDLKRITIRNRFESQNKHPFYRTQSYKSKAKEARNLTSYGEYLRQPKSQSLLKHNNKQIVVRQQS